MGSGVRGWQGLGQMEPLITAGFDAGNGELIDSTVDAEAGLFEARLNMGKEPFTEGTDKREHWQCDPSTRSTPCCRTSARSSPSVWPAVWPHVACVGCLVHGWPCARVLQATAASATGLRRRGG